MDLMFWICVLGKTTFSSYVGLKTVNYTVVCIADRLYRPSREVKHKTLSCAAVKKCPLYALMVGQGKLYLYFINLYIMLFLSRTVVILCYGEKYV